MCLSRALYETFVSPPTNHWAKGSFHTSPWSNGLNQCNSSRAMSDQNFTGSAFARFQSSSYSASDLIRAFAENSALGGKIRVSCMTESICPLAAADIDASPG